MTFDSGIPSDPLLCGFRGLESLSEEKLPPGTGFLPQVVKDTEIITYVREGTLIGHDPSHGSRILQAGEFQHTSAVGGSSQRAVNGSLVGFTHVFQSCFAPDRERLKPRVEQRRFPIAERTGLLRMIASPDGAKASLRIHRDVRVYSSLVHPGSHLIHELQAGRAAWLHLVKGEVQAFDHSLRTGDGAAFEGEAAVSLTAREHSEIILFDLA